MRSLLAALLLGVPVLPSAAAAQPLEQTVEQHRNDIGDIEKRGDVFVHKQAGYVYPAALGEMPARKTYTFGPGDAEVYYTLKGGANDDPWLSLYVYPAAISLAEDARNVEDAIITRMNARETSVDDAPSRPAGVIEKWYDGAFDGQQFLTGYRLSRVGDWFIKVRLTIPKKGGQEARARGMKALAAVPWTITASGAKPTTAPSTSTAAR